LRKHQQHKESLKTKVISSGVINPERAYVAAEKSKSMGITEAVSYAIENVKDLPSTDKTILKPLKVDSTVLEMKEFAKQLLF
jgi:hypothetical protein